MQFITENEVKRGALKFLKAYYKYRPREEAEPTISALDMRTASGIIADGFYSFRKPDKTTFVATFEATSYGTRKEVLYRPQKWLLFWDGFAIASIVLAFLFSYGYLYDHFTIKQIGLLSSIALFLIALITSFGLYMLFASIFKRYRYIYALEQFKRYHADEQWVAIADDLFENPDDKYLRELKYQCVNHGFGLIKVDKDLNPSVLITPARYEVFDGKRRVREFVTQNKWMQRMTESHYASKWQQWKARLFDRTVPGLSLLRYRKPFWHQLTIASVALFLVSGIFYKEAQDADLIFVDHKVYLDSLLTQKQHTQPEKKSYFLDTFSISKPPSQNWWAEEIRFDSDDLRIEDSAPAPKTSLLRKLNRPTGKEIYVETNDETVLSYDCTRFYTFTGTKYILEEGRYESFKAAQEKMAELIRSGLTANLLWLGCFSKKETDYIIYFDLLYNSEPEALEHYGYLLEMEEVTFQDLKIRPLTRFDG